MLIAKSIFIARISEVRTNCERAPANPVGMQSSRSGQQLSVLSEIIRFRGLFRAIFSHQVDRIWTGTEMLASCHNL